MILMHLPQPKKGARPQEELFDSGRLIQGGSVESNVGKNEGKSMYTEKIVLEFQNLS